MSPPRRITATTITVDAVRDGCPPRRRVLAAGAWLER